MNGAPSGERVHIGFFGVRNAGKSSLVNAITGQDLAVVSNTAGTTTDLVSKAMELLPVGPVSIIDTPGIDDVGELGALRVEKTRKALRRCHMAVLVSQAGRALLPAEEELVALFRQRGIPFLVARNKADLLDGEGCQANCALGGEAPEALVSALTGEGVHELKELMASLAKDAKPQRALVADLLEPADVVVLVIPIDSSAPKGRIILPQQMVLRDVLDAHASALCCQPEELPDVLGRLTEPPRLVITDSQVFAQVETLVPANVPLTSFSILMARYKGVLDEWAQAAQALERLTDADMVLVSEGCTHHRQCDDIGTVKIPRWIEAHCGARPSFEFTSGGGFPDDLSPYAMVIHCGGCMLNEREMAFRAQAARQAGVPFVNYGVAIAKMNGILDRAMAPLR